MQKEQQLFVLHDLEVWTGNTQIKISAVMKLIIQSPSLKQRHANAIQSTALVISYAKALVLSHRNR